MSKESPPEWLIHLCASPMGKAVFLFILRDRYLRERLHSSGYNGLIDFFVTSQLVNGSGEFDDMKNVDFTACSLSTLILYIDTILKQVATSTSYDDCSSRIKSLVPNLQFTSPEEYCIVFNYITCVQTACANPNINSILQYLQEHVLELAYKSHSTSIVPSSQSPHPQLLLSLYAQSSIFNPLLSDLQLLLNGDFAHTIPLYGQLDALASDMQQAFRDSPLCGLLSSFLFSQLTSMHFTGGRFLEIITRLVIWLLVGETKSPAAQEEEKRLLSVLQICTTRDCVRFRNEEVRSMLLRMCGPEGAEAQFGWFYREYCVTWIRDVGVSGDDES